MKKQLLTLSCIFSVLFVANTSSHAQSVLAYYWSFNNWTPVYTAATAGVSVYADIAPDYGGPGTDTSKARFIDKTISGTSAAYASYADVTTGDTTNAQLSTPAGNCFRARNPNDSLELLIYMPTTGYKNLRLKYACELSSYTSGDSINAFSYSVDSGATWITSGSGLSEWADSGSLTFRLVNVHINDTNAYNNRKFVFRINLVGRNSGSSGNDRFDNVTLFGDTTTGTAFHTGIALISSEASYTLHPNPATNQIEITAAQAGTKSVVITNILGQQVYNATASGYSFLVNISDLKQGSYFITIRENETGSVKTMKFIKQ